MTDKDAILQEMIDHHEIKKVLFRYCRSADRWDLDGMRSVFHEDAIDEHGMYSGRAHELMDYLESTVDEGGPLKMTQHNLGNIIIDVKGDRAVAESYCTSYQGWEDENGGQDELVGGRYVDLLEKRDGEWRILHRRVTYDWARINPYTEKFWDRFEDQGFIMGVRGKGDALYTALDEL